MLCLCVSEADDQAVPYLWPLKPSMGVFCWYIKQGRKGGSRIMQCGAAAPRARMSALCASLCACVCVSMAEHLHTVAVTVEKTK